MKARRRLVAGARREVRRLAAIAVVRASAAEKVRRSHTFRPLTEVEAEAIVGDDSIALALLSGGCTVE